MTDTTTPPAGLIEGKAEVVTQAVDWSEPNIGLLCGLLLREGLHSKVWFSEQLLRAAELISDARHRLAAQEAASAPAGTSAPPASVAGVVEAASWLIEEIFPRVGGWEKCSPENREIWLERVRKVAALSASANRETASARVDPYRAYLASTCPCVAAEQHVETCPKHGSAALSPLPGEAAQAELEAVAAIVGRWPAAMPEGDRKAALVRAGEALAPFSADPPGTPCRDALVIVNAAINVHACSMIARLTTPDTETGNPLADTLSTAELDHIERAMTGRITLP